MEHTTDDGAIISCALGCHGHVYTDQIKNISHLLEKNLQWYDLKNVYFNFYLQKDSLSLHDNFYYLQRVMPFHKSFTAQKCKVKKYNTKLRNAVNT